MLLKIQWQDFDFRLLHTEDRKSFTATWFLGEGNKDVLFLDKINEFHKVTYKMCVFWDKSKREDKTNRVNKTLIFSR